MYTDPLHKESPGPQFFRGTLNHHAEKCDKIEWNIRQIAIKAEFDISSKQSDQDAKKICKETCEDPVQQLCELISPVAGKERLEDVTVLFGQSRVHENIDEQRKECHKVGCKHEDHSVRHAVVRDQFVCRECEQQCENDLTDNKEVYKERQKDPQNTVVQSSRSQFFLSQHTSLPFAMPHKE